MDGRRDGRCFNSSRMNIKNHETKDHIHCTWTDCCLSIDDGSSIETSHFRAWRARYSRKLFCLFHECCVYFTSVRCRDWRHIDLNRVSKKNHQVLVDSAKDKASYFLGKIHHSCADGPLPVCFLLCVRFSFWPYFLWY